VFPEAPRPQKRARTSLRGENVRVSIYSRVSTRGQDMDTVLLADREGKQAMSALKTYVRKRFQNPTALVFASRRSTPLCESQVLREGLHPALKATNLAAGGMHGFRRGCNRRWELAGMNPAVLRQQMGHPSSAMTARYTGQLPLAYVQADFSRRNGPKSVQSENKENRHVA
jgi:Phage integrase family